MISPWIHDQLDRFYDRRTSVGMVGKVIGFRLMHLHGRALAELERGTLDVAALREITDFDSSESENL